MLFRSGPTGAQGAQGPTGPPSDRRLKDSVKGLKGNYTRITELRGVFFDWNKEYIMETFKGSPVEDVYKNKYFHSEKSLGFIAQEIEKTIPEVIWSDPEGYKRVEYGIIVSIAVGAIKEQQSRIDYIYERINKLKSLLSA